MTTRYRQLTIRTADASRQTLAELYDRYEQGSLDADQFVTAAVAALEVSRSRAVVLADASLAATLTLMLHQPVSPLGLAPDLDTDRLTKAMSTVLTRDLPPNITRDWLAGRVAYAETLQAGQTAMSQALKGQQVPGWRRVTGANACEPCTNLAEADFLPSDVEMLIPHPTCDCVAVPVLEQR